MSSTGDAVALGAGYFGGCAMTVDLNDDHEVSGLLWFAALGCCAVND